MPQAGTVHSIEGQRDHVAIAQHPREVSLALRHASFPPGMSLHHKGSSVPVARQAMAKQPPR
jgi:hypothetical protein